VAGRTGVETLFIYYASSVYSEERRFMANHKTFEKRHLRSLDKASANQPARGEREFFRRAQDVARHLQLSAVGALRSWLAQGLVTDADGWVKIGEKDRFLARVVKARIEAGLFGKGLDREGKLPN
jgi:hypothetical protein